MKGIRLMGILALVAAPPGAIMATHRSNPANAVTFSEQKPVTADAEKLAALDQAYKAGVLTKEEYEAKRAQLPGTASAKKEGGAFLRLKMVQVTDEGFGQRIEVLRLLIPSDWRFEGGTKWSPNVNCPANLVTMGFRAVSSDGRFALELLPSYTWTWYDDRTTREYTMAQNRQSGGCDLYPPMSAAEFLQRMVIPKIRPRSSVVGTEPFPTLAQATERYFESYVKAAMQTGAVSGFHFDAARIKLQDTNSGQPSEEWISAAVSAYSAPTPSLGGAQYGQMVQTNFYALQGQSIIAIRAPQGQLDAAAPLFATMLMTLRFNERWASAYSSLVMAMQNMQLKGTIDRANIWREAMQKTDEIYRESYENHRQVQDRLSEQFSKMIRGHETYRDPNTKETVELPAGYQHVWHNSRNEYLLTNSSDSPNSTDPNRNADWTQQIPVH